MVQTKTKHNSMTQTQDELGSARITPQGPLRDVRRALLEADVSLPVVRRFIKKVEERALGLEVSLR